MTRTATLCVGLLMFPLTATAHDFMYKCSKDSGFVEYQTEPCPAGREIERFDLEGPPDNTAVTLRLVKIGMSHEQVGRLGQVGNRCTNVFSQRPPVCGPLKYFSA
jgi:hypothetical protein